MKFNVISCTFSCFVNNIHLAQQDFANVDTNIECLVYHQRKAILKSIGIGCRGRTWNHSSTKIGVESFMLMIEHILVSILFNLTRATLLSLRNHINITLLLRSERA